MRNWLIFTFIILLAILLRSQELFSNNYLFLLDQGRDMLAVKGIVFDHHPTLIGPYTSLAGVFQGPLWYYVLAVPTFLTGGDPIGPLALMVVISMATVVVSYFWMRRLFGEKPALLTSFLFAVSPEAIAAATYSWNPHPMWLLLTVFSFCLYEVILGNKKLQLLLWPTIGAMFHFEMALAVFILAATVLFLGFFYRKTLCNKYTVYGVLIGFLFFVPQILFEFRHDFLMSRSVLALFSGSEQGLVVSGEDRSYWVLVQGHIQSFVDNFRSGFVHEGIFKFIPIVLFCLILITTGIGKATKVFSKSEWLFIRTIASIFLVVFLLTFLYPFPIRYWFLTGFQVFYILLAGLLLTFLLRKRLGQIFLGILVFSSLIFSFEKLNKLYLKASDTGGVAKMMGKKQAVDYIYKDAKGEPFNLHVFNPPVYTDAYDYIVYWHGQKTYGYLPGSDKKDTMYLLIEKDSQKPWSYEGWLETVIKVGNIEKTIELPSGLIVQKRTVGK